ncbi:hypothetical protein GGS23DRAFT_147167 [Durotheca rogersii]|uniref:uncharacterized protein n=1 Tax=Durotheca rogersii TaxID=419775 RepID=UPI0022203282|nr:uncharacterized protein GGS23DRAFT_147167 [Durotheca rogersii]KAI5861338.1 hypothetical protein GGS23DRAFT_147167 [Durotheca rogersii]
MLIDGEKWACEACVRGHRVSNCQHSDRPLQHINKKGRPVSQCQHCRAMRKSRSSHVKCDCGEKTHKCAHLKQTVEGHKDSCCCNHGGRCTCSHKKEPSLDTVPESESDDAIEPQPTTVTKPRAAAARRRRANTTHSEPVLSFDENGHHRPTQRHTKASQKSGPYTIGRAGSVGSSSSSSMHRTASASSLATKSVDSFMAPGKSRSRVTDSSSPDRDTRRSAKSAQASPSIGGGGGGSSASSSSFHQLNGQLPPLDLSGIRYVDYSALDMFGGGGLSSAAADYDYEPPMFSAGLDASVDWFDIKAEAGLAGATPSSFDRARSASSFLGGLDYVGGSTTEPTLTSNSGDVSETEDFASGFDSGPPSHLDSFRSAYLGLSHHAHAHAHGAATTAASMLAGGADLSTLDFDQFKGTAATSKLLSTQSSTSASSASLLDDGSGAVFPASFVEDDGYWSMSNFTDGITHSPDPVASGLWNSA